MAENRRIESVADRLVDEYVTPSGEPLRLLSGFGRPDLEERR